MFIPGGHRAGTVCIFEKSPNLLALLQYFILFYFIISHSSFSPVINLLIIFNKWSQPYTHLHRCTVTPLDSALSSLAGGKLGEILVMKDLTSDGIFEIGASAN